MKIQLHKYNKQWYKYFIPKKLTDAKPLYKWLFWVIELNKEEYQRKLYNEGQRTFAYCPHCDEEMVSNESYIKDDNEGYSYFKCKCCNAISKWDFYAPCPIILEYKLPESEDWIKYHYKER